jgi:hypothetical protein
LVLFDVVAFVLVGFDVGAEVFDLVGYVEVGVEHLVVGLVFLEVAPEVFVVVVEFAENVGWVKFDHDGRGYDVSAEDFGFGGRL